MDKVKKLYYEGGFLAGNEVYNMFELGDKINELVEAVNELEQVKKRIEELERDVICLGKGK